jgi:hypothetical protein
MTGDTSIQIWTGKLEELQSVPTVPKENSFIDLLLCNLVLETLQTLPTLRSSDVSEDSEEV